MPLARSFPPLARADARVLILGSMPGEESLRQRRYYAHPHNQFWPIMGALAGARPELPYAERVRMLRLRGIALWDVLECCERAGSLDGSIVTASEKPNNLPRFLRAHRRVRAVFFNGGKAASAFRRHVEPKLHLLGERAESLRRVRLPSTSPAHAGMPRAAKLAAWRQIEEFL
ncbi:MAG TPA: DNA-deoxyinosine glycosylase [Verrucomicrobiae bacterium]|nr:DNA-deoxyinosine glycosylase [Verrucomicrobiae bacterium]